MSEVDNTPSEMVIPPYQDTLSTQLVVGSLRAKVDVRKSMDNTYWPRWGVQFLDLDGSIVLVETFDISQPYMAQPTEEGKSVWLTKPEPHPQHCTCAECEASKAAAEMGPPPDEGHPMPPGGMPPPGGMLPPGMPPLPPGMVVPDGMEPPPYDPYGMRHPQPGAYPPPPMMHNPHMDMYGGYDLEQEQYLSPQQRGRSGILNDDVGGGGGGGTGSQKSLVRNYTEEEKEELRNVNWPKKIKNNGLPALWCHSCYLDKKMYKIVSPLSPKPSIVYFRHQQCNTSFHKGENLPKSIVKQYQDFYRNRGKPKARFIT